jgi:hypothetical protein
MKMNIKSLLVHSLVMICFVGWNESENFASVGSSHGGAAGRSCCQKRDVIKSRVDVISVLRTCSTLGGGAPILAPSVVSSIRSLC